MSDYKPDPNPDETAEDLRRLILMAEMGTKLKAAEARVIELKRALAFAKSVILSGEDMTPEAKVIIDGALKGE